MGQGCRGKEVGWGLGSKGWGKGLGQGVEQGLGWGMH